MVIYDFFVDSDSADFLLQVSILRQTLKGEVRTCQASRSFCYKLFLILVILTIIIVSGIVVIV